MILLLLVVQEPYYSYVRRLSLPALTGDDMAMVVSTLASSAGRAGRRGFRDERPIVYSIRPDAATLPPRGIAAAALTNRGWIDSGGP